MLFPRTIKLGVIFAPLLFWSSSIYADSETQYWNSTQISSGISEKARIHVDFIHRFSEESGQFTTRGTRAGISYKILENLTYAFHIENRKTDSLGSGEVRFIHQLGSKFKFPSFDLSWRTRLEQREFNDSPKILHRGRILAQADFQSVTVAGWMPFLSGEYFRFLNTVTDRVQGSYETRAIIGVSRELLGGELELGYMRRHVHDAGEGVILSGDSYYDVAVFNLKWGFN